MSRHCRKEPDTNRKGITIETGKWPADIDEDGKRYAEVIIQSNEKSLIIRRISFTLEGKFLIASPMHTEKTFIHVPIWQNSHMPQKLPVNRYSLSM
ncbi:MAG: hypothetical protein ACLUE2_02420 [Bacteroides cellulosilyticus]